MNNPTHHTCSTCGHTWRHGQHGGHSCATLMAVTIAEQARELAALKAQPSGVVLPERLDLPHRDEFESADQYAAAVGESKKWNACLDEVARLNSSPVSAGGVDERAAFYAGVKAASDKVKSIVADYDERHGSTDPDTGTREYPGNGEEWVGQMLELIEDFTGIVAPVEFRPITPSSAPSHGEQVREAVLEELLTRCADWCDKQPKQPWYGRKAGDMVRTFMVCQPLAAAPSACSQDGDI